MYSFPGYRYSGECRNPEGSFSQQNHAGLAQLVERPPCKRMVGGSNPSSGTIHLLFTSPSSRATIT